MPAQTWRSERTRELRRPENKQLGGHTFLTGAAWNNIQTKCDAKRNIDRVLPPMPMDTDLHASFCASHPILRVRLNIDNIPLYYLWPETADANQAISTRVVVKRIKILLSCQD